MASLFRHFAAIACGLALAACAPNGDGEGEDIDEDEPVSGEDALASNAIGSYVAIAPPEARVATAKAPALLGKPVEAGRRLSVIRAFVFRGTAAKLVVDADTMITAVVASTVLDRDTRTATGADAMASSPYATSLAKVAGSARALDRVSATASFPTTTTEPFALTIDMCQSRREWDRRLYEWAVDLSTSLGRPVPVGIAMTGGWAKAHPNELEQLLTWQHEGKLDITWINHSSTHPLHCVDSACRRAEFLTAASVDFDEEVLGLERTLLARDMLPSVIFRFPGLVHDARRLGQLSRLSLFPLDANGWIAKGQPIAPRAVVLVHGNGNEPPGISGFLTQAESRRAALRSGKSALVSPLTVAP
jgi:hypothetical protein